MFVTYKKNEDGRQERELFCSPLEKQMLKSEIEHIMEEGGVYFAYIHSRGFDQQELRAEGDIFNSKGEKIGTVIGALPVVLRAISGGVEGIKVKKGGLSLYMYLYPLDEIIKLFD